MSPAGRRPFPPLRAATKQRAGKLQHVKVVSRALHYQCHAATRSQVTEVSTRGSWLERSDSLETGKEGGGGVKMGVFNKFYAGGKNGSDSVRPKRVVVKEESAERFRVFALP